MKLNGNRASVTLKSHFIRIIRPSASPATIFSRNASSSLVARSRVDLPPKSGPVAMRVGSTVPVVPAGRRRLCGVGPQARRRERRRRAVAQRTVRPDRVVLLFPLLTQHPRLQQAGELFGLQQLIPQPAVERLGVAVLPRCPRLNVQCPDARLRQPGPQRLGDQLRSVVAAQMTGSAPFGNHTGQHRHGGLGCHAPAHLQRQTLAGELVHQHQPLQRPPVLGPVMDKIPRPDVILVPRPLTHATVAAVPQPTLLVLFPWDLETLLPPQPVDTLAVDPEAGIPQQCPDASVTVTRVLADQLQHLGQQGSLLLVALWPSPLRRARLSQHTAGPALGDAEGRAEVLDRPASAVRAQKFPRATSLSIWLSRASSATSRFRRAFSASNSRSRLASLVLRPP